MASPFKMGSISDIVNNSAKKKNKMNQKAKRNSLKEEPQTDNNSAGEDTLVVSDDEELVQLMKPASKQQQVGKKRKVSESENVVTAQITEKAESPKKKAKRNKKTPVKAKPSAVIKKEPEENQSEPEEVDNVIADDDDSGKEEKEADDLEQENSTMQTAESEEARREKLSRTLFIGNLPANFPLKDLKKLLTQYGSVASIRVRSVAPSKQTLSKKVAYLSKQIHPGKNNVNAYAVFKSFDSLEKALVLNGTEFAGNIIQVDRVAAEPAYDRTNAVFLGNLFFKTTENELREFFSDCGDIHSVRIVRDRKTGIGKGFGYVNFAQKDGVVLALEKNGQVFKERPIRIQPYHYKQGGKATAKKGKKAGNKFQKQNKSPMSPNRPKPGGNKAAALSPKNTNVKGKPNKKGPVEEFKGEVALKKKMVKKTLKSKIKSVKVNKQKKKIAEILSK